MGQRRLLSSVDGRPGQRVHLSDDDNKHNVLHFDHNSCVGAGDGKCRTGRITEQRNGKRRAGGGEMSSRPSPVTHTEVKQEAQLMLTTGSTRLAVSRGQQTWYHPTCYI